MRAPKPLEEASDGARGLAVINQAKLMPVRAAGIGLLFTLATRLRAKIPALAASEIAHQII